MRLLVAVAWVASAAALGIGIAGEPADTRRLWVYEGGWFAHEKDESWYELNEETYRRDAKPRRFREIKRTRDHVILYDASRMVAVRLSDSTLEARWDADGKEGEWKLLYKGRWKKPVS